MFEYKCNCGHREEKIQKVSLDFIECPLCGQRADRMLSSPQIKLDAVKGDFPTALQKWEKMHRIAGRNCDTNPIPNN